MKKINFQNLQQNSINELVASVKDCTDDIVQLTQLLPVYDSTESESLKNRYRHLISEILKNIKNKEGFIAFLQLNKIEAFNSEKEEVIPECLEVVNFINKNIIPSLPWNVQALLVYTPTIEKSFAEDPLSKNNLFVNDNRDLRYAFSNDPLHLAVLNLMTAPNHNPRAPEIFNIYVQYLIANALGVDFKIYSMCGGIKPHLKWLDLNEKDQFFKSIDNLFKEYYKKIKSTLDPNDFKPPKPNTDWIELLNSANELKEVLIDLKEKHNNSLRKFNSEELDELILDLRTFLNSHQDLDELKWPKVKDISEKSGGAGLLKKINLKGGMKEVGKLYMTRIVKIIEKENSLKVNNNSRLVEEAKSFSDKLGDLIKEQGS